MFNIIPWPYNEDKDPRSLSSLQLLTLKGKRQKYDLRDQTFHNSWLNLMLLKITIEINITRPPESFDMPRQHVIYGMEEKLKKLWALIENIKAFTTLLWQLKAFKEGFYLETICS